MIGYSPLLVRRCWRSTRAAKKAGPTPPATTDSRRPPRGWQRLRPLHDTGAWERRRHPARHCWGPADGVAVRTRRDRLRHPNRGRWRRIHPWRPAPRAVGRDRGGSLDGPVRSTAGVSTDGDRLYLPIDDGALVALDTADGTERWRVSLCLPRRASSSGLARS